MLFINIFLYFIKRVERWNFLKMLWRFLIQYFIMHRLKCLVINLVWFRTLGTLNNLGTRLFSLRYDLILVVFHFTQNLNRKLLFHSRKRRYWNCSFYLCYFLICDWVCVSLRNIKVIFWRHLRFLSSQMYWILNQRIIAQDILRLTKGSKFLSYILFIHLVL